MPVSPMSGLRNRPAAGLSRPAGAFAFFDVDETLVATKTMLSFQEFWYRSKGEATAWEAFRSELMTLRRAGASREALNRRYYASFAGRSVGEVDRSAAAWYGELEASRPDLYHRPVVDELRRHQAAGWEAVLVSGSFPALLRFIAGHLGVRHILATRLEERLGRYTGEILSPQTIGEGKALAIRAFLERQGAWARRCHAYGDDISDLPMLEGVGHPTVVRGDPELVAHAERAGWPVLSPS